MRHFGHSIGIAALSRPQASAPGAVRYWRLFFTESNDVPYQNKYITIAEIQFRQTVGTPATMSGTGTASASSYFIDAGTHYTPANGADGNSTSYWVTNAGQFVNSWWQFTFNSPVLIKQYTIQISPGAAGPQQAPKAFRLQYSSDGVSGWTDVQSATNQINWTASETRTYTVP